MKDFIKKPPMGWNSWDCYGASVNEEQLLGNAEYMAKNDLRKAGLSDELIAEATGYAETDDQEILDARALFAEALAKADDVKRRQTPG